MYGACCELGISSLVRECEKFIESTLTSANFVGTVKCALLFRRRPLLRVCYAFFKTVGAIALAKRVAAASFGYSFGDVRAAARGSSAQLGEAEAAALAEKLGGEGKSRWVCITTFLNLPCDTHVMAFSAPCTGNLLMCATWRA